MRFSIPSDNIRLESLLICMVTELHTMTLVVQKFEDADYRLSTAAFSTYNRFLLVYR